MTLWDDDPVLRQYVQYIRNAGGGAPLEIAVFDEHWDPIGPDLRRDMLHAGVTLEQDGYMILRELVDIKVEPDPDIPHRLKITITPARVADVWHYTVELSRAEGVWEVALTAGVPRAGRQSWQFAAYNHASCFFDGIVEGLRRAVPSDDGGRR